MAHNPMVVPVGSFENPAGELTPIWNNLLATPGPGPALAATGNSGVPLLAAWPYRHLLLMVYIGGAASGSLTVSLAGYAADLPEQQAGAGVLLGTTTAVTTLGATTDLCVGPGTANEHVIPGLVQVQWTLTGGGASFADCEISLWGRS
jgi:hypothetical protein